MRIGILLIIMTLAACSSNKNSVQMLSEGEVLLEQYFNSQSKEALEKLHKKLATEGYQVSEQISYEHEGKTEWSFYSTEEVKRSEISQEDEKAEKNANQFEVNYDGHGFSLAD